MVVVATVLLSALAIGSAWAYWSPRSSTGSNGASAATTIAQGATPTVSVTGGSTVTLSWAARTLASGQSVSGYIITRYNASNVAQTMLSACTGTVAALSCIESSVPAGTWTYTVTPAFATNWRGAESAKSASVVTETVAPTNSISVTGVTGGAARSGSTVYYRGVAAGVFALANALTDAGSGPASSQTTALTGTTTGWTHTPSTVSAPAGGPYVSNTFTWTAGTTSSPVEAVTGKDVAGNSATTTLTFTNDSTPPTAGSISYANGPQGTASIQITFAAGTDSGSGISIGQLQRSYAPLSSGVCGSYNPWAVIGGANPTSPYTDSAVGGAACYQYRYVVPDLVGNQDVATSSSVATFTYSSSIGATSSLVNYYRLGDIGTTIELDSQAANNGTYFNGPTLGVAGAISGDSNTAVQFDGINDYSTAARQIATDFTIEFWFKSTQTDTFGTGCNQWWDGARLVDADQQFQNNDFGTSLCGGKLMAGVGGTSDVSFKSTASFNDGAWHHVVMTRTASTAVFRLYADGVLLGSATGTTTAALNVSAIISFGRAQEGNDYYTGTLDEVALYSSVLTSAQISGHYALGKLGAADTAGPSGGSVGAVGLVGTGSAYSTSLTLSVGFAPGTDPAGIASSGNQLFRSTATLTSSAGADGVCGTFGSYALVTGGTDPVSPKSDSVSDQACYRYQYVVSDSNGNATTYTSGAVKVDSTAPSTPTYTVSAFANAYWSAAAPTVIYYRPGATSGSFAMTASSTDAASGLASYAFPALGTGWTSTPGATGVNTYSWSAINPAVPGAKSVTATNNTGVASAAASFTPTVDSTAPAGSAISYANGSTTGSSVSVSFTTGTDAGSGIGIRLLQRASAPATAVSCGTYGGFTTVTNGTNPTSPVVDTVAANTCYKYQYVVSDNVGNSQTVTSTNVAHVPFGAYWTFEEGAGTTAADSSGNGNTATLQAAAGWRPGVVGANALSLNGTATSWASAASPVVDTSQSYSVSAWVKLNSLTGSQTLVSVDGTNVSPFILQKSSAGVFRFVVINADSTTAADAIVTGPTAVAGTWYHLVGVYDKTAGTAQLYVNGVSQGTASGAVGWAALGSTNIGRTKYAGANADYVNGTIDDVHFYDRAITQTEVTALATVTYAAAVTNTAGLVNYFRLDESSANNTAADSVGSNPGTYTNGPTRGVAGALSTGGTAVQFDGVDDYVSLANPFTNNFSIEFWFKSTQGIGTGTNWWEGAALVDADVVGGTNADFGVSLRSDGKVVGGIGNPDLSVVSSTGGYNDGNWHHVVFTRTMSSGLVQLYVDGSLKGSGTGNLLAPTASTVIRFGQQASGGKFFAGTLDEVALYTGVLSQATVSAHYAAR